MTYHLKTEIPPGVRDLLPNEAWFKRELEIKISNIFKNWGYDEVVTPSFEFFDILKVGQEEDQIDKMYKFLDRQGRILALRPDMTTPISRLTASRLKNNPLPFRLFYIANVFSYEEPQAGRQREYYQAGIEFIGSKKPEADAEVLAVAIEALKNIGLENFKLSMGQIDIFNGLMEELNVSDDTRKEIKNIVSKKDFVGVEELLVSHNISEKEIKKVITIITLRGGKEKLADIRSLLKNEKALKAVENLEEIYSVLSDYNLDSYVDLDLGLLRGFEYYTGFVFEGFSPHLGFPICGGGRYDNLIEQFGLSSPATGFALGIERVIMALERQGQAINSLDLDYVILYKIDKRKEAFEKAKELRDKGYRVVTASENSSKEVSKGAEVITI